MSDNNIHHYRQLLEGNFSQIKSSPNNTFDEYLFVYQSTFQHLLLENITLEDFEDRFDDALASIESLNSDSPYRLFYEAEIRLFAAIVYYRNKQQLDAGWQIRQSFRAIRKNNELFPEFAPNLKTFGFLQIALGAVPEKYQWLLSIAGMHGSVNGGIKNLEALSKAESIYATEATYLLALSYTYILGNSSKGVTIIAFDSLESPLYYLIKMSIFAKNNQGSDIIDLTEKLDSFKDIPQLDYLIAEAYLQNGEYNTALIYYQKFVKNHTGYSNKSDAYFKMALCSHYAGNMVQKTNYLSESTKIQPQSAADKNAFLLIQDLEQLNYGLLELRMATDGGFYHRAERLLENIQPVTRKDSIELTYRKARLYHKTDRIDEASKLYQRTIAATKKERWYFAPNSALNLGFIKEDKNQFEEALECFQLAKSYKHHTYKNSIDSKSEAGIDRIKDQLND